MAMNWARAKRNPRGYEEAFPRQQPILPSLDSCMAGVRAAVEVALRIGNERWGIKTDCLRCWKQLRLAIRAAPKKTTFLCSECGTRWRRVGHRVERMLQA